SYTTGDEPFVSSWAWFYQKKSLQDTVKINVHSALRPLVYAFAQADDNVTKAIRIMMTKNVNLLPAFEGHKPVGILRSLDILDYISGMLTEGEF
ncbi:MAG TPA: CBS domain-containing protein, partial [Clostridia bacterium]|nr:CBS domain-containing protein [Clostridia bacterium]